MCVLEKPPFMWHTTTMLAVTQTYKKNVLFVIICLLAGAVSLPAQESPWYEEFFVEGSALVYFPPQLLKEYIEPGFGFRGALGYEYQRFRFALESGYSRLKGTGSLVSQIDFVPLVFKFGYALPLYSIFGLQADLSAGFAFSKTKRYPPAIDLAMDKAQEDRESSFISGGRLYATVTPRPFLRIYAGGGMDIIFEKEEKARVAANNFTLWCSSRDTTRCSGGCE